MMAMLAFRQRCCAAARAASKSFYQGRHEQKKQVVEGMMGRGGCMVELPRSTWRYPSRPHAAPISPFSRPMLLLAMRGAKGGARPSTAPASFKPKNPSQQKKKQVWHTSSHPSGEGGTAVGISPSLAGKHPDVNSTSDLFVRWEIPWDGKRVIITMAAIGASVLFSALVSAIVFVGFGFKLAPPWNPNEIPIFLCIALLSQTLFGMCTMKTCIKNYSPLPKELFSYDWRNPFDARRGWLLWGIVGIFCTLAASVLTSYFTNMNAYPADWDILRQLQSSIGASGTSTTLLLVSAGILAPLWEETIFRGFLMTSLTKWVPTQVAVFLSAGAFALVHFNPGKLPLIFALGVVLGFSYSKTGNLLTPIMIHGGWNSAVLVLLTFLRHSGYDIQKLLGPREITHHQVAVQKADSAEKKEPF